MDELPDEVKEQLKEQKKNCPFCKIISGEIPAKKVYEDNEMAAILDINPCTKGHTLIMPNEHYPIMPLIPSKTFKQMFGQLPGMVNAIKKAMLTTGANAVIANGAVAGQQSPHFMIHLIPREKGDWIDKYAFKTKDLEGNQVAQAYQMLAQNLPIMLNNHFSKNPAQWSTANKGEHDKNISREWIVYEDEKTVAIMPEEMITPGHIKIYSREEKSNFENLDFETASHMFYVASFASTAVYEGLKAHGSNIILKTGLSDDNPEENLEIHVLPRYEDDGLELINPPMQQKPDMEEIYTKIKDQMFYVEHKANEENKNTGKIKINLDKEKASASGADDNKGIQTEIKNENNQLEEVRKAIEKIKKS